MKRNQILFAIFAFVITAMLVGNANAQFGDLINKAKNKMDKGQKKVEQTKKQTPTTTTNSSNQTTQISSSSMPNSDGKMQSGAPKPGEAGFIGLSKKPIDPNNLSQTQWTKNFANGEYIYGIVYLPQPLSEYLTVSNYNTGKKDMVMGCFYETGAPPKAEDNKLYSQQTALCARIYVMPETMNQTYATFAIFPDPKSNFSFSEGISGYSNVRYFLENAYQEARVYDMAMRFKTLGTFETVAETEGITIDLSNKAPYTAMKSAYEKSQGQEMSKQVTDKPLEPAVATSPVLQKQFAALAQSQLGNGRLLKLNILSPSWQIVRNEITGIITHRYMSARGIVKESEGYCRTRYVLFTQSYNGAGYGVTQVNASGATDDWVIPCERAK